MELAVVRPPRKIAQQAEAVCPYCGRVIYQEFTAEVWDDDLGGYVTVMWITGAFWQRIDPDGHAYPRFPVCTCPAAKRHPITEAVADIARPIEYRS